MQACRYDVLREQIVFFGVQGCRQPSQTMSQGIPRLDSAFDRLAYRLLRFERLDNVIELIGPCIKLMDAKSIRAVTAQSHNSAQRFCARAVLTRNLLLDTLKH